MKFELELDECWIQTYKDNMVISGDIANENVIRDLILFGIDSGQLFISKCEHDKNYDHSIKVKQIE